MSDCLTPITLENFDRIYQRVTRDFPDNEHPPYGAMWSRTKRGVSEGFLFQADGIDCAYVFTVTEPEQNVVLLYLLAVYEEYRGSGIGGRFMKALGEQFAQTAGILIEVEKPELAQSDAERRTRTRRIAFYERAGYAIVPGFEYYSIWDVPYHIMALPRRRAMEDLAAGAPAALRGAYLKLIGQNNIHKLVIRTQAQKFTDEKENAT